MGQDSQTASDSHRAGWLLSLYARDAAASFQSESAEKKDIGVSMWTLETELEGTTWQK
jgi:hypothetical protein